MLVVIKDGSSTIPKIRVICLGINFRYYNEAINLDICFLLFLGCEGVPTAPISLMSFRSITSGRVYYVNNSENANFGSVKLIKNINVLIVIC